MNRKHSRPQLSVHCGVYRGVFLPWWDGKGRDHPAPLIVVRGELALERDFPSACSWHPCPPSVLLPLEEEKKEEEEVEKEVYKEVEGEEQVLPQVEEGLARQSPSNWGNNLDRLSGLLAAKLPPRQVWSIRTIGLNLSPPATTNCTDWAGEPIITQSGMTWLNWMFMSGIFFLSK